jgi:hypothetical protein
MTIPDSSQGASGGTSGRSGSESMLDKGEKVSQYVYTKHIIITRKTGVVNFVNQNPKHYNTVTNHNVNTFFFFGLSSGL